MTDRPITFSAPMVRALLAGTKTQTRRVLKPQPGDGASHFKSGTGKHIWDWPGLGFGTDDGRELPRVHYAPGDRLWCREAWKSDRAYDDLAPSEMGGEEPLIYLADNEVQRWGWKPDVMSRWGRYRHARFMPRWASRLTLHVTEVRVQRLQEISAEDARAEGVNRMSPKVRQFWLFGADAEKRERLYLQACKWEFEDLWSSLHGEGAWDANPWVSAITFTVERANIDKLDRVSPDPVPHDRRMEHERG